MYRNTRFGDVMKGLSRGNFEKTVTDLHADKFSKGFRCWDQLIAMVYAQLSGCRSLREVEAGFNSQASHHYHLGSRPIKRSTLADANGKRPSEVYEQVCQQLLQQAHRRVRKDVTALLYLLDSSPIPLKGLGFDEWTKGTHNHRTHGLKVHMVLAPDANVPVFTEITAPNVNDIEIGKQLILEKGATYVFDKGYCDYNWWHKIHCNNSVFVTRFKKNAGIENVEAHTIPDAVKGVILADDAVTFKNRHPGGKRVNDYHGTVLRRVVIARPGKSTPIILATNDFERSAQELADLYKRRWDIELFFKWLKQNLKIKQFLGRSENAVKIQIYTAIITYLLVSMYRRRHGIRQSLKLCLVTVSSGLFQRPELEYRRHRKWHQRRLEYQQMQGVLAL
jgi:IS4 transposase